MNCLFLTQRTASVGKRARQAAAIKIAVVVDLGHILRGDNIAVALVDGSAAISIKGRRLILSAVSAHHPRIEIRPRKRGGILIAASDLVEG